MRFDEWLQREIHALVGVQRCMRGGPSGVNVRLRSPDLVVHMWTGVHVHIYIIDEPLKSRTLKGILQADTSIGISTMFILAAHLLPPTDQNVQPAEWLQAIHTLSGDRLYAYRTGTGDPTLFQAHLERVGTSGYFRLVTGPTVVIQQIRYARVTLRPRGVRGFWMGASFGADPFWKREGGARRDAPPRYAYRSYGSTHHSRSERAETRTNSPPVESQLASCYALLEINHGATRDEVKAAFRRMARRVHPDVSDLDKQEAELRFKLLSEAYEYIKTRRNWS